MNGHDLFQTYTTAYLKGSTADRRSFLEVLANFDFSLFRIDSQTLVDRWTTAVGPKPASMWSNGSSNGKRNNYKFAPFDAVLDIEELQKGSQPIKLTVRAKNPGRNTFSFDYGPTEDFAGLWKLLVDRPRHLIARPHIWLYLTSHPMFIDRLIDYKNRILSIVSTDWEPFFAKATLQREGIHINDCMIDWQTGLNFHTCRYGVQHFLPIFVRNSGTICNWLNLADKTPKPTNDRLTIQSLRPELCRCGKWRLPVHIGGRSAPFTQSLIADLVRSHYKTLQFIRDGRNTHIFYSTEGTLSDFDRQLFNHRFTNITYHRDKLAITGIGKWPAFWDTSLGPFSSQPFNG